MDPELALRGVVVGCGVLLATAAGLALIGVILLALRIAAAGY